VIIYCYFGLSIKLYTSFILLICFRAQPISVAYCFHAYPSAILGFQRILYKVFCLYALWMYCCPTHFAPPSIAFFGVVQPSSYALIAPALFGLLSTAPIPYILYTFLIDVKFFRLLLVTTVGFPLLFFPTSIPVASLEVPLPVSSRE